MKLLLADDHGLFRDSMALWLRQLADKIDIVLADDLESTQKALQNTFFDLVVLDLYMPQMRGAMSITKLCTQYPGTKIVIVSADESTQIIEQCIAAGAKGYVPKSSAGDEILKALGDVLNGKLYLPKQTSPNVPRSENIQPLLTDNQLKILALIGEGKSNKEIAASLFLSEGTIKQYVTKLLRLLEVDNRVQASAKATEILSFKRL